MGTWKARTLILRCHGLEAVIISYKRRVGWFEEFLLLFASTKVSDALDRDAREGWNFYEVWYWLNTPPSYRAQKLIGIFIRKQRNPKHLRYPFIPFTKFVLYGEVREGIYVLIRLTTLSRGRRYGFFLFPIIGLFLLLLLLLLLLLFVLRCTAYLE